MAEGLSLVTLGDPTRPAPHTVDFSGFRIPRRELGRQAVRLLEEIPSGTTSRTQQLLPREPVEGSTPAPPARPSGAGKR